MPKSIRDIYLVIFKYYGGFAMLGDEIISDDGQIDEFVVKEITNIAIALQYD